MIEQLIEKIKRLYRKDPALFIIWASIIGLTIIIYSFFYSFNSITLNALEVEKNKTDIYQLSNTDTITDTYALFSKKHPSVDVDVDMLPSMTFTYKTFANLSKSYTVYLNFIGNKIYYQPANDTVLYQLSVDESKEILLNDALVFIYPMGQAPITNFLIDNQSIDIPFSTDWYVKRVDKQYYNLKTDYTTSVNETAITGKNFNLSSNFVPTNMSYSLYKDGVLVDSGDQVITHLPIPKINGEYTLAIYMHYSDLTHNHYKGDITYLYNFIIDGPPFFEISQNHFQQGEIIKIYGYNMNKQVPFISQNISKNVQFHSIDSQSYIAYIPTSYLSKEATYDVTLGVDQQTVEKLLLTINKKELSIQYLVIDEDIEATTRSDEAYAEFNKKIPPLRNESESFAYFRDDFILPLHGRLTTEYGETRYVNGSPTSYFHSGLDIAAPTGTPIYATNTGKVIFADHLILTGNTVVIDHGIGFISLYYHMDSIDVEVDQVVEINEEIGTVGTTGFSTGPHLHFILGYYDINLAPGYIFFGEEITYENYKELFQQ